MTVGHSNMTNARKVHVQVTIEGQTCRMEVDSGSYLSMVSWATIKRLIPDISQKQLKRQTLMLKDYQGNKIRILGIGQFRVTFKEYTRVLPLAIVDRDRPSLLGLE
ncbi:hypothetical protein L345_07655, partial [Ophiophagus hannah]